MRLVPIIILILVGFFVFRYVIRKFMQEIHRGNQGGYQYQSRPYGHTEEEYRQILGIADNDSPAGIRKKYKELLAKYHPDKVQHLGMEFQEMAEEKTRAIMEAYDFFKKKHNL